AWIITDSSVGRPSSRASPRTKPAGSPSFSGSRSGRMSASTTAYSSGMPVASRPGRPPTSRSAGPAGCPGSRRACGGRGARAGRGTAGADERDDEEPVFSDPTREFVGPERVLFAVVHAELSDWLNEEDEEGSLSDFQKSLARDLPHRQELRALAGRLWPDAT